ncbi:bestrophin-like domain [Spirosoma luteolum]
MDWIYTLSNSLLFALCCGISLLFSVVGLVLMRPWVMARVTNQADHNDLVSYFLGASGVIYGILLGLVAAGVWSNFQELSGQVDEEATITAALYQDMATYPEPYRRAYQQELKAYVRAVIEQDWPAHHRGRVPQASSIILRSFKNHLFDFAPATPRMNVVHQQAINQLNELLIAHRLRLRGDQADLPPLLWWVILLGALINVAISWFFVSHPFRIQLALTALIALLLGSLLFLTAAMNNPLRGGFSVDASAFESVLYEMVTF